MRQLRCLNFFNKIIIRTQIQLLIHFYEDPFQLLMPLLYDRIVDEVLQ